MNKIISRDSVRRANSKIMGGYSKNINMNCQNVSVKCHTTFGTRELVVSREKIAIAAKDALRKSYGYK